MSTSNTGEQSDDVLGCGLAFPLRLNGGVIGLNAHEDQIQQAIRLILRTAQGERVMRPDFGSGADLLAFEPMNTVTAGLVQHRVKDALTRFEPRIEVLDVTVRPSPDQGLLSAEISYRIKRTNAVGNMVYPFYVERGEG